MWFAAVVFMAVLLGLTAAEQRAHRRRGQLGGHIPGVKYGICEVAKD